MGGAQSIQKINYEDVQSSIQNPHDFVMISTLQTTDQQCLIPTTISADIEEVAINRLMKTEKRESRVIVYGKNSSDELVDKKCNQLYGLGFINVYVYSGGMFEWLMLQDIYGELDFPTTSVEIDLLKYKPMKQFNSMLLN